MEAGIDFFSNQYFTTKEAQHIVLRAILMYEINVAIQ